MMCRKPSICRNEFVAPAHSCEVLNDALMPVLNTSRSATAFVPPGPVSAL